MKIDVSGEDCIWFELNQDGVGHISGRVYKKAAGRGERPHGSIEDSTFLKKFEVESFAKGCVQTWLAGSESCHVKPLEGTWVSTKSLHLTHSNLRSKFRDVKKL